MSNRTNPFFRGFCWSDTCKTWNRFLWDRRHARQWDFTIRSHGGEDWSDGDRRYYCRPYLHIATPWTPMVMVALPRFLLRVVRGGEYGVSVFDNLLSVYYGRQTSDSLTEKRWSCFLPWLEKRFVRYRYFALDNLTCVKEIPGQSGFSTTYDYENSSDLPKCAFRATDYDGEVINIVCYIREMTWKHGTKWCKWLSWFVPDVRRRFVDLAFSPAYGPRKNDWKGGTLGHSEDTTEGEVVLTAVQRYCAKHGLTLIE